MSHSRTVCEHGVTVTQCRCAALHKRVEVVRPCPFGDKHLGRVVVHPDPRAGGAGEPGQLPAGAPEGACPVSLDALGAHSGVEGVGPRAVKLCVFRSCDWTTPEVNSLLELPAQNETFRAHLRTHRVEIELMAEVIR